MRAKTQEFLNRVEQECQLWEKLGQGDFTVQMDLTTAIAVCGALQLALRHPEFKNRPTASEVKNVVLSIRDHVPEMFPSIRELIELGFNPKFDS